MFLLSKVFGLIESCRLYRPLFQEFYEVAQPEYQLLRLEADEEDEEDDVELGTGQQKSSQTPDKIDGDKP